MMRPITAQAGCLLRFQLTEAPPARTIVAAQRPGGAVMARAQLVEFPSQMKRLVRLVEESDPAEIVEVSLEALRAG